MFKFRNTKKIKFKFSLRQLLLVLILLTTGSFYIVESIKAKRREEAKALITKILFLKGDSDFIDIFKFRKRYQISFYGYLYPILEHKNKLCRWKAAFFLVDLEFKRLSSSQKKKIAEILSDPPFLFTNRKGLAKLVEYHIIKIGKDAEGAMPNLLKHFRTYNKSGFARDTVFELALRHDFAIEKLIESLIRYPEKDLNWDYSYIELELLGKFGLRALPFLIEAIEKNKSIEIRRVCVLALKEILPYAKRVSVTPPVKHVNSRNYKVSFHPVSGIVLPVLLKNLQDKDYYIKLFSVRLLVKFGKKAKVAVLPLLKLLQDEDKFLRFQAALALVEIDPTREECLPIFREFFKDRESRIQHPDSLHLVRLISKMDKKVFPVATIILLDILKEHGGWWIDLRWAILDALAEMGPLAKDAVPYLLKTIYENGKEGNSEIYIKTLEKITGKPFQYSDDK